MSFLLPSSVVNTVFIFQEDQCIGINKENYQDAICLELGKKTNSTLNIKDTYCKNKITIRFYCVIAQCKKKYKISCVRENVKPASDLCFELSETDNHSHDHGEMAIRNLNKKKRAEMAKELNGASVEVVRNEKILSSDKAMLANGNLQDIYSVDVLRKVKSEQNTKRQKSTDPMVDLILRSASYSIIHSIEWIKSRFSLTIITDLQIEIFKKYYLYCKKNNKIVRVNFDATGGILAKINPDISSLLHHVLVIPWKFNANDRDPTAINIAEFIASNQKSHEIEIFLQTFKFLVSKKVHEKGEFNIVLNLIYFFNVQFLSCSLC
jgi:hypothetical protein